MQYYERSYGTARTVFAILELVGWAVVAIGALSSILGLINGGITGVVLGNPSPLSRILAAVPGIVGALLGLLGVAIAQSGRAVVDTAEMTRDHLQLARVSLSQEDKSRLLTGGDSLKYEVVETYLGVDIVRKEKGLAVGKRLFATPELARAHIDREHGHKKDQ